MKKPLFKYTFLLILLIWSLTKETNAQIQGLSNIPISLKINQPVQTFESIRNDANNYFIPLRAKNDGNPIQEEKVFRRWEYYTKSRCMYPGAPVGGSVFGVEQYMKSVNGFYVCNTGYSSSPWTSIGQNPTPIDKQDIGIIISVEVDPNNSNI